MKDGGGPGRLLTSYLLSRARLNGLAAPHATLTPSSLQLGDKSVCIFWGPFVAKVGPRAAEAIDPSCIRVLKTGTFKGDCSHQVTRTGRRLPPPAGGGFLLIRASVCYFLRDF